MHPIAVLALPGVVAFDLAVPTQVFGHPDEVERYEVTVCAADAGLVASSSGFGVQVPAGLEALRTAGTVVVPGFWPHDEPGPEVVAALRQAADRGARMVSVCTGAFALAAAGLLDGVRVTTHWRDAAELAERYPAARVDPRVLYVADERVWSSAGIAAGIDLCVHLVRADHGEEAATEVARRMVVPPHRDGGQAQFLRKPVPAAGEGLRPTCAWALEHLSEPLSVEDLARHAGWAPRTLARRFVDETGTTPMRWLTAQRLSYARRMLEQGDETIDRIASASGLGTSANLRVLLGREVGLSPSAYRRVYRGRTAREPVTL